ncbi:MAG: D-ribose pyranase [Bifidobacterium aquikefiri]|uniref:D-ribose pyranase n=1 Tax=Bifidobacterium aquikefiri TaxID=1653207 RepID=A0A261G8I6_9BIFI|nr:D-ribose pyranase [Bifidobacterium aquikefiri]OZG67741.1 ribose pyranase [Bifidobacterium aquikefiri]
MKKTGILNSELAKVADDLGHTDLVCIGDLGLPVPNGIHKIDIALKRGEPSFIDVLQVYLDNVVVQQVFLASEIKTQNPAQLHAIEEMLPQGVGIDFISHEELKQMTRDCKAVLRTGEDTPYSNIILQSGVTI